MNHSDCRRLSTLVDANGYTRQPGSGSVGGLPALILRRTATSLQGRALPFPHAVRFRSTARRPFRFVNHHQSHNPKEHHMNNVSLIGNLTRDPELRTTPSGTSVSDLRLAINRPKRNGEEQGADYVDVVCWGVTAENCAKYLAKGRPIAVTGRLRHSEWETDGQRRSKLEVVAEQIDFLNASTPAETRAPAEEVAAV
jgi:single-strand DNA-binding protein